MTRRWDSDPWRRPVSARANPALGRGLNGRSVDDAIAVADHRADEIRLMCHLVADAILGLLRKACALHAYCRPPGLMAERQWQDVLLHISCQSSAVHQYIRILVDESLHPCRTEALGPSGARFATVRQPARCSARAHGRPGGRWFHVLSRPVGPRGHTACLVDVVEISARTGLPVDWAYTVRTCTRLFDEPVS
jgi:hypothetical protein